MKIKTLSHITTNLVICLSIQQTIYGLYYLSWIDFTTWSATTLGFELLFLLSIVFYSIERSNKSLGPMKSSIPKITKEEMANIYFPKD